LIFEFILIFQEYVFASLLYWLEQDEQEMIEVSSPGKTTLIKNLLSMS